MKNIATVALMLNLGVAGVYAQQSQVNMTFSGTAGRSPIELQAGTPFAEYRLAGDGTLGPSDLRAVSVSTPSQQPPDTCSGPMKLYASAVTGAGVFRFEDGGLLKVNLTGGGDCVDLSAQQAICTRIFQITGGTGRFNNASGTVTLTMTLAPVLANASNNPVFFAVTGELTGTVSGVAMEEESQAVRR